MRDSGVSRNFFARPCHWAVMAALAVQGRGRRRHAIILPWLIARPSPSTGWWGLASLGFARTGRRLGHAHRLERISVPRRRARASLRTCSISAAQRYAMLFSLNLSTPLPRLERRNSAQTPTTTPRKKSFCPIDRPASKSLCTGIGSDFCFGSLAGSAISTLSLSAKSC